MEMRSEAVSREIFRLLRQWCDALLSLQIDAPDDPARDGAIACPACGRIHGRCHEAVYPFLYLAQTTGEKKYRNAARRLFNWAEILREPDGGLKNDTDANWKGTTVFCAIALHDALVLHGGLLAEDERSAWNARLAGMGQWLFQNLAPGAHAYVNYYAANACAMALLGRYFDHAPYLQLAAVLAEYCAGLICENGLLLGEGRPHNVRTEKGCRAVDIGYNAEESLPVLYRCAVTLGDARLLTRIGRAAEGHLAYMLPDGAWDNSMGTRAFKWTYWGSRTADGCTDLFFALGKTRQVFAEAAWRNFMLLRHCSGGGLLFGGPDYRENGEPPCVHHTFCHAKSLAAALDAGVPGFTPTALPVETLPVCTRIPETDTLRLRVGSWLADVTAYDYYARRGAHVTGGSISLLYHSDCGPVFAAGMADYTTLEPNNQQPPSRGDGYLCPCMRVEAVHDGIVFAQHRDAAASVTAQTIPGGVTVTVHAALCDVSGAPLRADGACSLVYTLTADMLRIEGKVAAALSGCASLALPVVSPSVRIHILRGAQPASAAAGFCLTPGFRFREYRVAPDDGGRFCVCLTVSAADGSSEKT